MSGQPESPSLRSFQSLHRSFLCTPADSFLNGSTVSSPCSSTDDSFQGGMKNTPAWKLFTPMFTVDKLAVFLILPSSTKGEFRNGVDHSNTRHALILHPLLDFWVCCHHVLSPHPPMTGKRGHRKDAGYSLEGSIAEKWLLNSEPDTSESLWTLLVLKAFK